MSSRVIAIDGPAASGKSTVASQLSRRFGIAYVSTGSLYRAVGLAALEKGLAAEEVTADFLNTLKIAYLPDGKGEFALNLNGRALGAELRAPEVAAMASAVATRPEVREYLLDAQRNFARGGNLIVMEGRDIGTVIFPDAEFKFFVTASPEERAMRRLRQDGGEISGERLRRTAEAVAARDKQDAERKIAPLKPADDAEIIDTTGMTIDAVVNKIAAAVKAAGYGERG